MRYFQDCTEFLAIAFSTLLYFLIVTRKSFSRLALDLEPQNPSSVAYNGLSICPKQVVGVDRDQVESIPSPSRPINRWLNVVLDLNGILCMCEEYRYWPKFHSWNPESNPHSSSVLAKIGPKAVYVHPLCSRFLSELSHFADFTVWSSMHESTT